MSFSKILISACMMGQKVRYDGQAKASYHPLIGLWRSQGRLIPCCPEVAAGLPTPRPPAEIEPGFNGSDVIKGTARVFDTTGCDVSAPFVRGATLALRLAKRHGCQVAVLTEGSPSCGSTSLYSGAFDGVMKSGQGATTALLQENGVLVFNEQSLPGAALALIDIVKATNPVQLNQCLELRHDVFIVEQNVPVADEVDGLDATCSHFLALDGKLAVGAARLLYTPNYAKIQRVCVAREYRKIGLGDRLIESMVSQVIQDGTSAEIRLGAQTHALAFYKKLGFDAFGLEYLDAGILHRDMKMRL